jgi:hypothetical protein
VEPRDPIAFPLRVGGSIADRVTLQVLYISEGSAAIMIVNDSSFVLDYSIVPSVFELEYFDETFGVWRSARSRWDIALRLQYSARSIVPNGSRIERLQIGDFHPWSEDYRQARARLSLAGEGFFNQIFFHDIVAEFYWP